MKFKQGDLVESQAVLDGETDADGGEGYGSVVGYEGGLVLVQWPNGDTDPYYERELVKRERKVSIMALFNLNLDGDLLKVGFGEPASNDAIVKEVSASLKAMSLPGGPLLKINGSASLPVVVVIAHSVVHLYGAVAVWDPKLGKYVVAVSHNPAYGVGDLID